MDHLELEKALQKLCPGPSRTYEIDSRHSTPDVFPYHGFDDFEFWRETLGTISRSIEELDTMTPTTSYRMEIMDTEYWKVESMHWKSLFAEILVEQSLDASVLEHHCLDIDAKYWDAVSSFDWRQSYQILDTQCRSNLEDRRSIVSDTIFHKIAAGQWELLCSSSVNSEELWRNRTTIRNSHYWQTEFTVLSEALRKLRSSVVVEKRCFRPASSRQQHAHRNRVHKERLRNESQTKRINKNVSRSHRRPRTSTPETRLRRSERIQAAKRTKNSHVKIRGE